LYCIVLYCIGETEFFEIVSDVRQGCILSPILFIIVIDCVMIKATDQPEYGIKWQRHRQLTDLDFADDIAMITENNVECQEMTMHTLTREECPSGIANQSREDENHQNYSQTPQNQPIVLGQNNLECVERFTLLLGQCHIIR